ncbi:prolipoprotein diacylglyceryl transferase, partial [Candidatus Peregrinibacteria bacterium]|nr:prolipoprotein diacylglyceryl transferase [Candidatus Peregrinibacteria bacterium]
MYPILLEFGSITVFALWLFVAAGYMIGTMATVHFAKRFRVKLDIITENSKLFFMKIQSGRLLGLFTLWDKGLSFWGAILGLALGILYFARKGNESPLRIFDVLVPGLLIGMIFGDVGAFLDGKNYGTPSGLPWAVSFRNPNVKFITPVHPTQLYAAAYTALLALGLVSLAPRIRGRIPGFIAELGLGGFSVLKFLEEFFRGDETTKIFSLRLPQIIAFAGIIFALYRLHLR